jgi:hypothetical protein
VNFFIIPLLWPTAGPGCLSVGITYTIHKTALFCYSPATNLHNLLSSHVLHVPCFFQVNDRKYSYASTVTYKSFQNHS